MVQTKQHVHLPPNAKNMKKDAKPNPTSKIAAKKITKYNTQRVNILVRLLNDANDGPTLYTKKQAQQIIDWYRIVPKLSHPPGGVASNFRTL
jgi:hypothetical protein